MGNQLSSHASISNNGRFVAFISDSDNLVPNDYNQSADAFLHDRLTNTTKLLSLSSTGDQANGSTLNAYISGNGRYVVFESTSSNLVTNNNQHNSAFYIHDILTSITEQFNSHEFGSVHFIGISDNGRYIALRIQTEIFFHDTLTHFSFAISDSGAPLPASNHAIILSREGRFLFYSDQFGNLQLYDRVLNKTEKIISPLESESYPLSASANSFFYLLDNSINAVTFSSNQLDYPNNKFIVDLIGLQLNYFPVIALANDGNYLIAHQSFNRGQNALIGYDLISGQTQFISTDVIPESFSLSGNGLSVAYAQVLDGIAQIYVQDRIETSPSLVISGRVVDASGLPLALVTLQDDQGHTVKTDRQGNFWINGISQGSVILTPSKEGYIFEPTKISVKVLSDITNITFIVSHAEVLEQAQLDIGMPYSFERGCETPWQGCDEEFHGFSSGYCTDLILDAYLWGVDFNIQTALERDYQAHPEHFYRWRNARNAHDMWRYFSYNGQIFPHTIGYLPGDIVFFDWSGDGEIDHVSIISEITSR
ncbi:MAG: amidase domain-containing protein, partial [Chloroflexi bacterium]|nr:amidase domain-containing protein [Chloroflexota bacterium]